MRSCTESKGILSPLGWATGALIVNSRMPRQNLQGKWEHGAEHFLCFFLDYGKLCPVK